MVGPKLAATGLMPQQLADLYFRYAQLQLAGDVAGEPAGSMALHALGKVYSQLGRTERELNPQADRRACEVAQQVLDVLAQELPVGAMAEQLCDR